MLNIKIVNQVQKLYDKYELYLNKMIGSGSYSNVYQGKIIDKNIMKKYNLESDIVAIKKIKLDNIEQKTFKMINDEVNIMHKIKNINKISNNIIKCYDIFEEYDYIYLVLEYCENGDLSKIIGKPIKESIVKYYFSQIINALIFLNENNIIHRDIKPKNILLKNEKKDLVLCDFGFARIKSGIQRVKTICGSPLYMAPELLEEKTYTEIVDIWAIGMILFEMIYGNHPYNNCRDIEDLKEFSKKDIQIPPEKNNNQVSDECIDLLKKMLNKNEIERIKLSELFIHPWLKDTFQNKYKLCIKNLSIKEIINEDEDSESSNSNNNENENENENNNIDSIFFNYYT